MTINSLNTKGIEPLISAIGKLPLTSLHFIGRDVFIFKEDGTDAYIKMLEDKKTIRSLSLEGSSFYPNPEPGIIKILDCLENIGNIGSLKIGCYSQLNDKVRAYISPGDKQARSALASLQKTNIRSLTFSCFKLNIEWLSVLIEALPTLNLTSLSIENVKVDVEYKVRQSVRRLIRSCKGKVDLLSESDQTELNGLHGKEPALKLIGIKLINALLQNKSLLRVELDPVVFTIAKELGNRDAKKLR